MARIWEMVLANTYVLWFVLGLGLVITDLFIGTIYLLVVAVGFGAAGLVSLAGGDLVLQLVVGAAVGLGGALLLRRMRWVKRGKRSESSSNPDMVIDIGQIVHVTEWINGFARVQYRGSYWDAVSDSATDGEPGVHTIKSMRGSTLVLAPVKAHHEGSHGASHEKTSGAPPEAWAPPSGKSGGTA